MKNKFIQEFEGRIYKERKKLPKFRAGDTVKVLYKVEEGSDKSKFRLQSFEGVVLRVKSGAADGTFTVRKIGANGVGVERVFPTWSPRIDRVEVLSGGIVRRARLYYLRGLAGKAARIKSRFVGSGNSNDQQAKEPAAPKAAKA